MRPFSIPLAAALLMAASPFSVTAVDPVEPPTQATSSAPAPDAPVAEAAAAVKSEAPSQPATATTEPNATTAADPAAEKSTETPADTSATAAKDAVPPMPQVITAQIDPELALRLSLLEKTMLAQSEGQAAIYGETTRLLMFFGTACVAMGLIAMVAAVFLMNRTLASVSAITAQVAQTHSGVPALPGPAALVPATGTPPSGFEKVQASGQRFQSRMTSLEQRLEELENLAGHGAPSPRPESITPATSATSEISTDGEPASTQRVIPISGILVRKAEALMNLGKLDEAMATLDEAARHDGDPVEIHMARGRVQERQGRLGDALQSYDLAVSSDQTNTAALLMKAGVLNRQERFDEALGCYERALALHRAAN